jgi:hypothetical protein
MNERINDLMNQAMPIIDWKARHGVELNNGERMKWYAEWFENFAELIVQECINQVLEEKVSEDWIDKEDDIEDRCYLRGNNGGIVDAVIRIKQHFGVEE